MDTMKHILIAASLIGCGTGSDDTTVTVEPNELGITQLKIEHTSSSEERVLALHGLDQSGQEIATVTLRTGMVWYGADMPADWHPGTDLELRVRDASTTFTAADRLPHEDVIPPGNATIDGLARVHEVVTEIYTEAGITLSPSLARDEVAFTGTQCGATPAALFKTAPLECCIDTPYIFQLSPQNALTNRYGFNTSFPACRFSNGTTGCVDGACTFGPCGSAVNKWGHCNANPGTACGVNGDCPTGDFCKVANDSGKVFVPHSGGFCGWDKDSTVTTGTVNVDFNPENYDGTQTLYATGSASCVSTTCIASGAPSNWLTGNIPAHGTGKFGAYGELASSVGGLDILNTSGAATAKVGIATGTGTTVTACPDSQDAKASISGSCTAAQGAAGACVNCTISNFQADKTVTATFACTIEFGC